MRSSDNVAELAEALGKLQKELPALKKNRVNTFLNSKYADLEQVVEASKPLLDKYGLTVIQLPVGEDGKIGVTTRLVHGSNQWIEETFMVPAFDQKGNTAAQAAGQAITYFRRYALVALFYAYSEDDKDGATGGRKKQQQPPPPQQQGDGQKQQAGPSDVAATIKRQWMAHAVLIGVVVDPSKDKVGIEKLRKAIAPLQGKLDSAHTFNPEAQKALIEDGKKLIDGLAPPQKGG